MKEIETYLNMDTTKRPSRSCDASNVTDQETKSNLQMFTPIMKQETVHFDEEEIPQCIDEEKMPQSMDKKGTLCNDYMSPCKPLKTSNCVDDSDCKFYVLDQVKKEFPEDESPQPASSISSRLAFENEELSQVIERQEFKQEHIEESLSLVKNEEIKDKEYPFIVKIESLEEPRVLDNFADSGVHYDVLVTPHQVQCKLCDRTFNNRYNLLIHNNEHIKVVLYPTPVDIVMIELHKCKCCHEHFNSRDNMLAHVRDVHSNGTHKSKLHHEGIKPYLNRENGEKVEYKCDLCDRFYQSKTSLVVHTKKVHVDYGRMFKCWCGQQFRSPIHLSRHKRQKHDSKVEIINNEQFQCNYCQTFFKTKLLLIFHIKRMHYDHGKTFDCSCGKQFRTPLSLSLHKRWQHNPNLIIMNKQKFQCDNCHKFFKTKFLLVGHIKSVHNDYGKVFECSCGEQFRSPIYLYIHKKRQHGLDDKIMNNEQFPCDSCPKIFKSEKCLARHIQGIHYDYGKKFECSCGKQFRTPTQLYQHKQRMHLADGKDINNGGFQCHICQKLVKTKNYLITHIKNVHYDYGKTFDCRCGKRFRTPKRLRIHEYRTHGGNSEDCAKFHCDACGKFFKKEKSLIIHRKSIHNDYGEMFLCWCGKQFSKSMLLHNHERRHHNNTNNAQFQCRVCKIFFKTKKYLTAHNRNMHYDYGKVFACWCGKEFRTPLRLRVHHKYMHNNESKDMTDVNTNTAM